ncbi:MAG: hypothetical protein NTW29_14325 [Bacteroidetes bacterium]|nr:hypothetical protein [Bacteroidota bacterium]
MKKTLLLLVLFTSCLSAEAQKKKKGKNVPNPAAMDYQQPEAVADTATKFTGVIKYRITTDDAADNDSMFIVFGSNKIRVTMFIPGSRPDQQFENNFIANLSDSTLILLDKRTGTYKTERLDTRNAGTEMELGYFKKNGQILKISCPEYSGQMKTPDGEVYEAAALVSKQHSFISAMDYNFLNIQPVVLGYKIVLGWRTKTSTNESTYIIAYKIEPGNTDAYFDLSAYRPK